MERRSTRKDGLCQAAGCKNKMMTTWLGADVCQRHWDKLEPLIDKRMHADDIADKLGLPKTRAVIDRAREQRKAEFDRPEPSPLRKQLEAMDKNLAKTLERYANGELTEEEHKAVQDGVLRDLGAEVAT